MTHRTRHFAKIQPLIYRAARHHRLSATAPPTAPHTAPPTMETRIVPVPACTLGAWAPNSDDPLASWLVDDRSSAYATLAEMGSRLRTSAVPVAFPTETVYGLGADATRSDAVAGIYKAKGRPADNPLIVHVCDLGMLRGLLLAGAGAAEARNDEADSDPIPPIYRPLIRRFWPGPLTILLPLPTPSPLAREVTSTLATFGARMPASALARTLIALAQVPLAAPSANASTRPSPTTAAHVRHDLAGRIEVVLDGGPCAVGVESTVVDGLCVPPAVLRPGGVAIEQIRDVAGWEGVVVAYRDAAEKGGEAPRAPGMKYKHYSPTARVVLCEGGEERGAAGEGHGERARRLADEVAGEIKAGKRVGLIRTVRWEPALGLDLGSGSDPATAETKTEPRPHQDPPTLSIVESTPTNADPSGPAGALLDTHLGTQPRHVAHGLFAALRDLDSRHADVIYVEGIPDQSDVAAAVMNRLRKAASEIRPCP